MAGLERIISMLQIHTTIQTSFYSIISGLERGYVFDVGSGNESIFPSFETLADSSGWYWCCDILNRRSVAPCRPNETSDNMDPALLRNVCHVINVKSQSGYIPWWYLPTEA
uniref:Uncharacterized protein n=1 Tax=Compsopogon caeruleus TaxID=31354 RepID=A0A7S1XEZ6_9RHOD